MKRFRMVCEDADPEEKCPYSTEGLSMAEVVNKLLDHIKIYHIAKLASLNRAELHSFQRRIADVLTKQNPPEDIAA